MKHNYFTDKISQTKIKTLGVSLNTYFCGDKVAYKMYVNGKLLFNGNDYKPSCCYDWDSLDANLNLLGFLSVGIGGADKYYFENYTPRQMEWANDNAIREDLNLYISDIENVDLEDAESLQNYHDALKHIKHTTY